MFVLLLGYGGIFWFIGVLIVGTIIGWNKEPKEIQRNDNDYFTDEDFINVKVGEWISKPK
jgi:TM2 domain-containing membrane protein YozV